MLTWDGEQALEFIQKLSYNDRIEMCKQLKSLDSTDMHLLSCDSDIVSQLYHQQLPALYGRFHCTVFRGQRNHAWGLIPTCMRDGMDTDEVSNIIRRTRANMLQEMIVSTEFYKANYTVNIKISSEHLYTIYSDPWILAQHYGLSTPLIDYTSDPLVAMFFACTKFSENGWEPLTSTDIELSPYGRIFLDEYRMNPHSASSPNVISPTLSSRPMNQKGFLIRHPRFADSSIVFEHDPEFSQRVFDFFDGGKRLFSDRGGKIDDIASRLRESKVLSTESF